MEAAWDRLMHRAFRDDRPPRPARPDAARALTIGRVRRRPGSPALPAISVAAAAVAFVAVLVAWNGGATSIDVPWVPTLGLRIDLALDGLGVLYALLATGVGAVVFAYGAAYLPLHLAHAERPAADARRFWPWMVVFMGAMVGLACARDLVLLFLFFDVTAIASYFLIGFDRNRIEARGAALMSLTVTGVSAVLLLLGAVLLHAEYGTFHLPTLFEEARPGPETAVATALIAVAALAKSAQVPLHFWLPRAMAAPTPVSAYLHSAAMVAAGVLVLGRVHPLLALNESVLDALLVVGFASIAIGGLLALAMDELKQILAHSTISQYGYVVVLYGLAGPAGAGAAAFYVLAHAVAKSALFMTAGAVTESTGESRLSALGGLARSMPVLAASSAVAAAALAALPLTIGFFKDELFFAAALERGPLVGALAVGAAALTFAYVGRFWLGVFAGIRRTVARPIPRLLVAPIAVLALVAIAGGLVVDPFASLASAAASVSHGGTVELHPAYHLDARPENVMALAAWVLGGAILVARRVVDPALQAVVRIGDVAGPRRWYAATLVGVAAVSGRLHRAEVRDLRTSLGAIVVPTGILTALGFAATPTAGAFQVGTIEAPDFPLVVLLALVGVASITVARDRGRLRAVLALSVLGFALAAVYAVAGAPDVALVAVVVETMLTIVFVALFTRLPAEVRETPAGEPRPSRRRRHVLAGFVAGVSAFAVIWGALSRTSVGASDAAEHIRLAPDSHGSDVVTVILADFRGLDTMVEVTVLTVAIIGAAGLLRRGGLW